jgi:hypothetical protein
MNTHFLKCTALLGASLLALGGAAQAQSDAVSKSTCVVTGGTLMEPAGDREGHFIQASTGTCSVEGGHFNGGVMTQNSIWESDGPKALLTSGNGVIRAPGGIAVYQTLGGSRTLIIKDGKVAGWTATGRVTYPVATGLYASAAGKTFTWTARLTGPNQYIIESSAE